ncbi:DUF4251 domain-containing protein [uncultured Mucilaginibacter sp.]|uniref:DUF4251 domain-containing protein n=1 Tax=uncultured Mucilaginibacter sp. TaxID=797541 RepID=UPI0025FB7669|nr:DUF4251 domain-containing protein [uncultured Mucilaginibacter sp.]
MKTIYGKLILLLMLFGMASFTVNAQNARKERQAKKAAEVKALIDSGTYVFVPESANPMRGGNINLTPEYDLHVSKDTLIAYLPYFGQAYQAPLDPMDGGIHFTSTRFSYFPKLLKKGGWEISIKTADAKGVEKMFMNISDDGYASLQITSTNRDPISFQGYIEAPKKKKA